LPIIYLIRDEQTELRLLKVRIFLLCYLHTGGHPNPLAAGQRETVPRSWTRTVFCCRNLGAAGGDLPVATTWVLEAVADFSLPGVAAARRLQFAPSHAPEPHREPFPSGQPPGGFARPAVFLGQQLPSQHATGRHRTD
jgi:hypothetical protein